MAGEWAPAAAITRVGRVQNLADRAAPRARAAPAMSCHCGAPAHGALLDAPSGAGSDCGQAVPSGARHSFGAASIAAGSGHQRTTAGFTISRMRVKYQIARRVTVA